MSCMKLKSFLVEIIRSEKISHVHGLLVVQACRKVVATLSHTCSYWVSPWLLKPY